MQGKLDIHPNNFGLRLRAYVEGRGTIEQAYAEIGVSRATLFNWFERDTPPPGDEKRQKLRQYLGSEAGRILDGVQDGARLNSGGKARAGAPAGGTVTRDGPQPMVASRFPFAPGAPSTRADCEALFADLLDDAERTGSPNAFPVIYDWLRHNFPAHLRAETKPD